MKEIEIGETVMLGGETFEVIGDGSPTLKKVEMFEVGDYIWNGYRYLQICRINDMTLVLIEPKDGYSYSDSGCDTEKDIFTHDELNELFFAYNQTIRKATAKEVYEDMIKPRSC